MDPGLVLPALALIALGYVVVPVLLIALYDAQRDTFQPVSVACPRDLAPAEVLIDPSRLALGRYLGVAQQVTLCDLWPDRIGGCDRGCERSIEAGAIPLRWHAG